ncbi:hypothetical protein AALP_AA5G030200 [Arabis alpina]|uniref:Late embryogenesis abundant protein LEA-2 subgroup domain-containing protein n=1 Tax=Arabis alpina TaxID=50452 RepID=A0A087GUL4_ARAAL|nr:hypothetical protein AALP_AA5G030200 [Arabis alpina]
MSHHHYETNPHFSRLPPQNQHVKGGASGGASTSQTPPHHQPIIPPVPHHKAPKSHPTAQPGILIKSRGRQRQGPIQDPPHSAILVPLSSEDKLPPRKNPNSAKRPSLLSPKDHHQHQQQPPPTQPQPQRPHHGGGYTTTLPPIAKPTPWRTTAPTPSPHRRGGPRSQSPPSSRAETRAETSAMTWSAAFCCAVFWILLILGGLIILIVYFIYRPRSPYMDISSANLNAAYLDMGFLLNGDLTILANFTNPSKKTSVDFNIVTFDLYYYNTLIASSYVAPFKVPKKMSMFASVHLVSSQVQLEVTQSRELQRQIEMGGVLLNLRGTFHARSNLGTLFRYSYKLHTHCSFSFNSPPSGAMRARRCNTKR